MTLARRGRLRRLLGGGQPSLRATLFLSASTFLCGCVLASLLFVGIWRHTAGEAAESKAAVAHTRAIQQSDRRRLLATQARLDAATAQLAKTRRLLAAAQWRATETATALAHARSASRALVGSLTPRLQELAGEAATLADRTTTIESELTALATYARNPGAAGLDAGYLETQTHYVAGAAAAAASAAAALVRETHQTQAAAHT